MMMKKLFPGWLVTLVLMLLSLGIGLILPRLNLDNFLQDVTPTPQIINVTNTPVPTETLLPRTPLTTPTPANTLLPPPTFEPPTSTPAPSLTPSETATQPIIVEVNIPGIQGAESPTPSTTPGCQKNAQWRLVHEVKFNETLTVIAQIYGTDIYTLAQGNCLRDMNVLRQGQKLLVPGDAYPVTPEIICEPVEALQPLNNTRMIPKDGPVTFNWRGPRTPYALLRIIQPDGQTFEKTVELRQNQTIDVFDLKPAGLYEWWVLPLNGVYQQVCVESGPWYFFKEEAAPTDTPTPTITPTFPPTPTP
jgi:hypothetical protein